MCTNKSDLDLYYIVANSFKAIKPEDKLKKLLYFIIAVQ